MKRILLAGTSVFASIVASGMATASGPWDGYYAGLSLGYADHQARYEDELYDWYGSTHRYHPTGAVYGLQLGHNWQDGNFAWGIEADFGLTGLDRNQIFSSDNLVNNQVNWLATLRPRAGLALGNTWLYQTVGLAAGDFDRSWLEAGDTSDSWPDLGTTKIGVAAGFGIERAIGGNWSVRTEAQALRFFQNSRFNEDGYVLNIDDTIYQLKAGVNYAFGGTATPAQAFVPGTPFDFSGGYMGLALGGHMATVQLTDIDYDYYGSTYDLLSSGAAFGLHGGLNRQVNGFVYGLEGGINILGGRDNATESSSDVITSSANWGGNIKARAGAAAGNTMMYLTAGYALRNYDLVRDVDGDVWGLGGTYGGLIAGAGIEQALTANLTARIEATYAGIGGVNAISDTNSSVYRGAMQDVAVMAGVSYYTDAKSMGTGALAPANWAGFYAGLEGMFAYHQGSIFDRTYNDHGGNYTLAGNGAGLGVHGGYDWQDDTFVYGVVADLALLTGKEQDESSGYRTIESALNWAGTVRGRAGVATGDALMYATGGFAFGDADLAYRGASAANTFVLDGSRTGWTAGLGIEKVLGGGNSLKIESLYTKYNEEGATNGTTCANGLVTEPCEMLGYDDTLTVKLGYSWR